jgi:hypothetical protein
MHGALVCIWVGFVAWMLVGGGRRRLLRRCSRWLVEEENVGGLVSLVINIRILPIRREEKKEEQKTTSRS